MSLGLALLLAAAPAAAISITASVNKTALALDDTVVLSVTVAGEASSLPDPELPSMPRFNVHGSGRSQSMTFANGHISNTAEYTFVLVPRLAGNAVIPPITVHAGGQTAQTDPIALVVSRPNEAPPPGPASAAPGRPAGRPRAPGGPPIFVTAETDKRSPFVNEETVFTVRFHYGVPLLGNAEWSAPDTTGLLAEDLPPAPTHAVVVEGRNYNVSEVKLVLFPLTPGNKTIGPGTIRCQIQKGVDVDPFASDFFRQFFSAGLSMAEPVTLQTKPITLAVRPLPEAGKPAGFSGAVGKFKVRAEADKASVKAGDAVNLTITVEGSGNLKALADLTLPEMPQFRLYETVSSLNQSKDAAGLRGSKVYKTVVVPKVSGSLRIPAIPFHYFDPAAEKYVSLQTAPIDLTVTPGDATQAPVGFQTAPGAGPGAAITTLASDIRHIHSRASADGLARAAAAAAGAGWLHAFPAALLLGAAGLAGWRERLEQDPKRARARRAARAADERLTRSRASKNLQDSSALVGEALIGYLADKLAEPPSGLTMRQAVDLLKKRYPKLPDGHVEQVKRLWGEMERLRYAPTTLRDTDVAHLRDAVKELLKALEEST